jgi:chromosome segregation ATPase
MTTKKQTFAAAAARAVSDAEQALAEKRLDLEAAVAAGDVERVMALRTFTEIEGPRFLTMAKVAKLDSDIDELEQAIESGDLQRAEDEAGARMQEIQDEAREVTAKLEELTAAFNGTRLGYIEASKARTGASARLKALRQERGRLAERSESEIAARIRQLAGLPPEPIEEPPKRPRVRQGATTEPAFMPRESIFTT